MASRKFGILVVAHIKQQNIIPRLTIVVFRQLPLIIAVYHGLHGPKSQDQDRDRDSRVPRPKPRLWGSKTKTKTKTPRFKTKTEAKTCKNETKTQDSRIPSMAYNVIVIITNNNTSYDV